MISHFIKRNIEVHSQSFSVRHDKAPHFLKLWHHHQELELVLVLEGEGTRFIGDSMEPFGPDDLVLLGEGLPHKWQNKPEYFEDKGLISEGIIIHFEKGFLSNALQETVEFKNLLTLVKSSERGIFFKDSLKFNARSHMQKILETPPGISRMIQLLDLLRMLSEENDFDFITSAGYINSAYERDLKLRKVNDYVMNNFQSPINLQDITEVVFMNESAFCRYFKKATGMTFSEYVNEIRLGYACKLLQMGHNKTIADICYESGFNNLSNFNLKFKQRTGFTPNKYRKEFIN